MVAVDQSESALQEWFGFAGFIYRRRSGQQFKPCLNQLARRECSLGNSFTRLDFSDLYIVSKAIFKIHVKRNKTNTKQDAKTGYTNQ